MKRVTTTEAIESATTLVPAKDSAEKAARNHLLRVLLAFAAIYLIWGSTFLGIRIAIESIPAMIMAGVRWIVAGSLLYAFLSARGAARPGLRDWGIAALAGSGIVFCGNGSVTWAEQSIPSGTAAVLVALIPIFMTLAGWISGRASRPRLPVWLGIALATAGVVMIVRPGGVSLSPEQKRSVAILLGGEIIWSAASLYAARVRQRVSGFLMASMQMLCGGACLLATAGITGEFGQFHPAAVTLHSLLALVYLTAAGSIVAFCAYLWLLRNVDPTRVATYAYVNPVVAVFLGSVFAGETLAPALLAGSAFVILGIALIVSFRSKATTTRGLTSKRKRSR